MFELLAVLFGIGTVADVIADNVISSDEDKRWKMSDAKRAEWDAFDKEFPNY
jgi:hypothetical protein